MKTRTVTGTWCMLAAFVFAWAGCASDGGEIDGAANTGGGDGAADDTGKVDGGTNIQDAAHDTGQDVGGDTAVADGGDLEFDASADGGLDSGVDAGQDTVPPDTSITSSPPLNDNSRNASFVFACSEDCTFECKLDAGVFEPCISPKDYFGLADGSHSFEVRATDAAGNLDSTPATHTWSIDATPPDTTLVTKPDNPTSSGAASFTFTCSEQGCTFECKLDSGAFEECASPKDYSGLADGTHLFEVRAKDGAGNFDPTPAQGLWVVDATPPDRAAVVSALAYERPDLLARSCVDDGGDNEFLFEAVRRLRREDRRWGLNWKRGVVGDMSQDVVDYYFGPGEPFEGATDVFIIDIIVGHRGPDPSPGWIDQTEATRQAGTIGRWTLAGRGDL